MATLLLELFSEEIPSRMQRGACEQLQRLIAAGFEKAGIAHGEVRTFVSPRHLAIQLFGLPLVQPDISEERKGPKVGAPAQAMQGFLNAVGLTAEQCEQRDGYYFARIEKKGRAMAELAKEVAEAALTAFVWPKSMQWGDSKARPMRWVRPLHAITCLLDDAIVPVQFGHLTAAATTYGHRFLAPGAIHLRHAEEYEDKLKAAHVVVNAATRRDWIATEITQLAKHHNLEVVNDPALLDEVTGLVEWPVPLLGTFDASFLSLPPEVLISEMKVHQRYFALRDASGTLTNQFIAVANMITADEGKAVIAGNSRVLRARLSDGAFYWEQDKSTRLEAWGEKLADVVFHAKVGMMNEKVQRIEQLAVQLVDMLCHAERSEASAEILRVAQDDKRFVRRAAHLCKADLTSGMVGEFPELQGIMGRYYANAQGEAPEVAEAIYEHYKPQGANDSVPETALGSIIAVADKLDSIISLFAAGEKPTGSKDPFALRRAALGV
ncbi:MAG: glycine--tRNA ligase subunit beta, partial [Azospirillum brasilense]